MANVSIWTGFSAFSPGQTTFGFYDHDPEFAAMADPIARMCANNMGFPEVAVELNSGSFYNAFEDAVLTYARELYNYQIRDNYLAFLGTPSASFSPNQLPVPNLGNAIRVASAYASEAGVGGHTTFYTGSIDLIEGSQNYDLTAWAQASASLVPGDDIEIKRVFHEHIPAIVRWYDPQMMGGLFGDFQMDEFGFAAYGNMLNYTLMPLSHEVLRTQTTELNDHIRRSHYTFELVNNKLRIFPIPRYAHKLFFHYIKVSERATAGFQNLPSGSITNQSQVPYNGITYSSLNLPARNWVQNYAYANALDKLAMVRGKWNNTVPTAKDDRQLNTPDVISASDKLKTDLLSQLREMFEQTSRRSQLERQQQEADLVQQTIANVPLPFYIG